MGGSKKWNLRGSTDSWIGVPGPDEVRGCSTWARTRSCGPSSIGVSEFRGQFRTQWNLTMAASALFMLPVIILFFLAQPAFVEGVTLTGVKG